MARDEADANDKVPSTRRDEILAIAARVISQRGIASATVRDIGGEAGILSGSLYYHFESKEQIIRDLLWPVVDHQLGLYKQILDEKDDPADVIRALVFTAVHEAASKPYETRIIRNDAHRFREMEGLASIGEGIRRARTMWVTVVRRGVKTGAFRSGIDPEVIVSAMFDAVLSSVRWFIGPKPANPDTIAAMLADFLVHGLTTDSQSSM